MRKRYGPREGQDKLYCPKCFESGTGAFELVEIRPARRPGGFPYLLTRRHECPNCAATFVSAERLGLAALRRAAWGTARPESTKQDEDDQSKHPRQDESGEGATGDEA